METKPATPLEYAPRIDARFRRRTIRRIVLLVLMLAIGGWIFYQRDDLLHRAKVLYWSHRCMTHVTPPGTVLAEYDPVKAAQLLATNPDYVVDGTQWNGLKYRGSKYQSRRVRPAAVYWPVEFRKYVEVSPVPTSAGRDDVMAFMGERVSPAGHRRLIVVPIVESNAAAVVRELPFFSFVLQPPSSLGVPASVRGKFYNYSGAYERLVLQMGVADPSDAAHISFGFEIPDVKPPRHGTLDVYLRDDDTLDCRVRDPATTQGL